MISNNEIVKLQRSKYLDDEISHDDYYLWLAGFLNITEADIPFKLLTLLRSKDRHFNDTKLEKWDSAFGILKLKAAQKDLTDFSLSTSGCILKVLARKMVENYKKGSFDK